MTISATGSEEQLYGENRTYILIWKTGHPLKNVDRENTTAVKTLSFGCND